MGVLGNGEQPALGRAGEARVLGFAHFRDVNFPTVAGFVLPM